jgi:hypothetical protein
MHVCEACVCEVKDLRDLRRENEELREEVEAQTDGVRYYVKENIALRAQVERLEKLIATVGLDPNCSRCERGICSAHQPVHPAWQRCYKRLQEKHDAALAAADALLGGVDDVTTGKEHFSSLEPLADTYRKTREK